MQFLLPVYEVKADRETGEWFGEPESQGFEMTAFNWARFDDNERAAFTTYQHGDPLSGETRALVIRWI